MLAIESLEASLRPFEQTTTREIYDVKNGKEALTRREVTRWLKPASKWAIEAVLGIGLRLDIGSPSEDLSQVMKEMAAMITIQDMVACGVKPNAEEEQLLQKYKQP